MPNGIAPRREPGETDLANPLLCTRSAIGNGPFRLCTPSALAPGKEQFVSGQGSIIKEFPYFLTVMNRQGLSIPPFYPFPDISGRFGPAGSLASAFVEDTAR
jgi:hypothetical protein